MMTHEEIKSAIELLRELGEDGRITTSNIIDAIFDGNNYKVRDTLIDLLKQADPDTHIELPKDAIGEYIHIGDELVSSHSKKKFVVTRLQYSKKHAWMVGGADKDDLSKYGLYAPCETRHRKPTVEDVLREFGDEVQRCCDTEDTIAEYAEKIREAMA